MAVGRGLAQDVAQRPVSLDELNDVDMAQPVGPCLQIGVSGVAGLAVLVLGLPGLVGPVSVIAQRRGDARMPLKRGMAGSAGSSK